MRRRGNVKHLSSGELSRVMRRLAENVFAVIVLKGVALMQISAALMQIVYRRPLIVVLLIALLSGVGQQDIPVFAQGAKPFGLPFAAPPGPGTWLFAQAYGNTVGAYANRRNFYAAGQGIHFGIDLSAACGTTIVAIGDGVVVSADGPWGSLPHNLLIDHPNGYSSMYGHLLERPKLKPGQSLKKGEPIALSGDPDSTCFSRPHLHLEIRNHAHTHWYNPMLLIEADWDALAITGAFGRGFERDLDNPRRWQSLIDQPEAQAGAPLLNDFAHPWPPAPVPR